ncbi:MAG: type IV secretion system DNA-binding domain-containing protein [Hyphomicrobium sp.]
MLSDHVITPFARTNGRHPHRPFGIRARDRLSHVYVIGKTGVGKTTLLETLLRGDIANGAGCALIDPHGDFVERVEASLPAGRRDDLVYLDVPDEAQPYGYNPFIRVSASRRSLVASGILDVFKKMWDDAWGPRMEHILRNALLALLDQPHAVMSDILQLLTSKSVRLRMLRNIANKQVAAFWRDEFPRYSFRYQADGIAPIQNKVGAFLADPKVRRILTRPDGGLRFRSIMDGGKILLINLAKGKIGSDSASLLGGLIVTSLGLAAFSRSDIPEADRRPFYIFIDEFQNFTTLALANMLSELRKFGIGAVLAHQYLAQLDVAIRDAVLGNVGTIVAFRLSALDAAYMAKEFDPDITPKDFINLGNHEVYIRLMIDGMPSRPFSAATLPRT